MNKVVRCCAAVVIFSFLLAATILVLPIVVDVQRFKPELENKLSDITGRSVKIGSNLGLSFVPALSISFSDFTMGNPDGYLSNYFFKIDSLEARIKILPLLKKNIEFSRFIVSGLEVNLEKNRDGRDNWIFTQEQSDENKNSIFNAPERGWSLSKRISIGLFAVTDGKAILIDRIQNSHFRIDDLMLLLHNFSFNNSVEGEAKASINGKSLTAEGKVGPYIANNEQGKVPFDLLVSFFDTFKGQVKGEIVNLPENQLYAFEIKLDPSAAKDLFASLDTGSIKKLRTEFSELQDVFTLRNDLLDNTDTMLKMPFANILISGTADHFRNRAQLLTEPQVLPSAAKEQTGRVMGSGTLDAPDRL